MHPHLLKQKQALHAAIRERKGFGSEGRRFQDDEADKPGVLVT